MAVFVEKKPRLVTDQGRDDSSTQDEDSRTLDAQPAPIGIPDEGSKLKRPIAKPRTNLRNTGPQLADEEDMQAESDLDFVSKLAAWAEETEKAEAKPELQNGSKSESSEPVVRGSDEDSEMNDVDAEGDYVYDTYIRHFISANSASALYAMASVGHLIIGEEDQELWQTYIDEDEDEREFDTDEEDSNG